MATSNEFLTQDEVDALLKDVDGEAEAAEAPAEAGAVQPYDITSARRVTYAPMPAIEQVNERFARLLRGALHSFLRRVPEIALGEVRTISYGEFSSGLSLPTAFNVVDIKPLHGHALVVFDAALVYQVVDSLFGGDGRFQPKVEGREFTLAEQRTIQRLVYVILEEYEKAWIDTHPLSFELVRSEVTPPMANLANAADVVVVTTFSLTIGAAVGSFHICLPYNAFEPIRDRLQGTPRAEAATPDPRWLMSLSRHIQSTEVDLVTNLVKLSVTVGQLMSMRVGDILSAEIPEVITAEVDGVPIFACRYGTSNKRYAVRVQTVLTPEHDIGEGENNA